MKRKIFNNVMAVLLALAISSGSITAFARPVPPEPPYVPRERTVVQPYPMPASMDRRGGARPASPEDIAEREAFWREHTLEEVLRMQGLTDEQIADVMGLNEFAPFTFWRQVSRARYFGQERSYTCGAAVSRMALHSLGRPVPSESQVLDRNRPVHLFMYPSGGGTNLRSIQAYIGEMSGVWYNAEFGDRTTITPWTFSVLLTTGVTSLDRKSIVGVEPRIARGFPYNGNFGHFIAIYAVFPHNPYNQAVVAVLDPWGGYRNNRSYERYSLTIQNLYNSHMRRVGFLW